MADKIIWSKTATKQFENAIKYIAIDSIQNAEKVNSEIIKKITELSTRPETHSFDKYKINNDGTYRAFEIHHYRVAYRLIDDTIRILRIRHTSMEPKIY